MVLLIQPVIIYGEEAYRGPGSGTADMLNHVDTSTAQSTVTNTYSAML